MSERWMRPALREVSLYYNPEIRGKVRMDTSTNPLGPNPVAGEVFRECLKLDVNQYPRPYSDALREALANFYSLHPDNFIPGNGSDEILDIIFKTFMNWGETVVMPYPTYTLHTYFVGINGGRWRQVDLTDDFQLDVDSMLGTSGKILILCTPNNPTANTFRGRDVEELIQKWEGPVVVDEAYGEFAGESLVPLVDDYDNLIVTRTFSKAYALAGMRIGYSVAGHKLTHLMMRARIPYSLNKVSERMAIAALADQEFVRRTIQMVDEGRETLTTGLSNLGFRVFPSRANFLLTRAPIDSGTLTEEMDKKGVLIRNFGNMRMLENCVRSTIGTRELNDLLLETVREVLGECR